MDNPAPETAPEAVEPDAAALFAEFTDAAVDPDAPQVGDDPPDGDTLQPPDQDQDGEPDVEPIPDRKDEAETLREQNARLEQIARSAQGRVTASQRQIAALKAELAKATSAAGARPDVTPKSLKDAREAYGDIVGPVADHIEVLQRQVGALTGLEKARMADTEAQLNDMLDAEMTAFAAEHPDGLDLLSKDHAAFVAWVEDQPKAVREAYRANERDITDGKAAAWVVGLYKQHRATSDAPAITPQTPLTQKRAAQLDGARAPVGARIRAAATPGPESDDPSALFDYWSKRV